MPTSRLPGLGDSADTNVFVSHLTPKQRNTVAKLVGEKCQVMCQLNGQEVEILWDTGAQVSIIPERVLQDKFPETVVKDIRELLEVGSDLKLEAANGTQIPYNGWVGLNFKLLDNSVTEVTVPFLVTKEELQCPIIGYNVIELFVKDNGPEKSLPAVAKSFHNKDASALVNFINGDMTESLCTIKTSKKNVNIPSGQSVDIPCRANTGPIQRKCPALFEPDEQCGWPTGITVQEALVTIKQGKSSIIDIPVTNTTQHDIVLPNRVILGRLQLVRSVTPLEVKLKEDDSDVQVKSVLKQQEKMSKKQLSTGSSDCRIPEVDLSGLTNEKKRLRCYGRRRALLQ